MITEIIYTIPDLQVGFLEWAAALAPVAGQIIGGLFDSENVSDTNAANLELARQQNLWKIQQWERENEYNLPSNQMQRLRDAGINPNLAFSNGQLSNVSASSPQLDRATLAPYTGYSSTLANGFSSAINAAKLIGDLAQQKMDLKLAGSNYDYSTLRNEEQALKNVYQQISNSNLKYDTDLKGELYQTNKEVAKANLRSILLQNEMQEYKNSEIQANIDLIRINTQYRQEEIKIVKQSLIKLKYDTMFSKGQVDRQEYELNLLKQGVNPNDPIWARVLTQAINDPDYLNNFLSGVSRLVYNAGEQFNKGLNKFKSYDSYDRKTKLNNDFKRTIGPLYGLPPSGW